MNLPTVDLGDPIYCNGCPCSVELFFQAHCLLYDMKVMLDHETTDKKSLMKRLRPDVCREENGL